MDEIKPPWVVFPELNAKELYGHYNKGVAEPYFEQWIPFWQGLGKIQQQKYLDKWDASQDWHEAIEFHFESMSEEELEEDYMESRKMLQEREKARESSAFSRLVSKFFGK